ncbi:TIGR04282 family arsenosugar biosynthesis glycosyltransferase [Chitinispirillales bacterium ANBcel5]|uniref:TIGR04282 family arsenosugar biosynthesis glycosyltransferase n=1 Tax=Cellulosispirillum alkaliphilum TaxID=3039283 RepID=UPI002A5059C7|nr:TIGR04282 family arsenosugar biosynthesis glycosyltransferase [Chitinispirillales bacterium ANBcel5]
MEQQTVLNKVVIIVITKTPDVPVKTRIAQTEGPHKAHMIYRELLEKTASSLEKLPHYVAYAGTSGPGDLRTIFTKATTFISQKGNDLGDRMKNACKQCYKHGYTHYILIGADCPQRSCDCILQAANHLKEGADVVLGPVEDGGYHLAGVNNSGLKIFDATQWGTSKLLKETLTISNTFNLRTVLMPTLSDIDSFNDYIRWKTHNQ